MDLIDLCQYVIRIKVKNRLFVVFKLKSFPNLVLLHLCNAVKKSVTSVRFLVLFIDLHVEDTNLFSPRIYIHKNKNKLSERDFARIKPTKSMV